MAAQLGGVAFVALGIFFGISHGGADLRGSSSSLGVGFLALNGVNALFGVFLLFGPGPSVLGGPRINLLGLQLMVGAGLGFYAAYTNLKAVAQALFVLLLATALAITGSLQWFGHNTAVFAVDNATCISYFGSSDTGLNRCDEKVSKPQRASELQATAAAAAATAEVSTPESTPVTDLAALLLVCVSQGYLQFVRVVGMTALFFLMGQIAQIFVALSEGGPLMSGGAKAGADDSRAPLIGGAAVAGGFGESQPQQHQHAVYAPPSHAQQQQQQQQQQQVAQPYAGPAPSEGAKGTPSYQTL